MKTHAAQAQPGATARVWLLATLALAAFPHLLRLPPWLALFCLALGLWRGLRDRRGWPLPGQWARLGLTLAGVAGVLLAYHTLLGRDAGMALLTVMLWLKLLELKTVRDAMVVVFLAYFLVAGGFFYDQSLLSGSFMVAVVVALTGTLVAVNHRGEGTNRDMGYLRLGGGLVLRALPLMAILFVLFPRISGPLWGLPEDAFAGRTGLSDQMTLGSITRLVDSDAVAFRAEFDGPAPPMDQLYWRGPVLSQNDGRHWRRAPVRPGRPLPAHAALTGAVAYTVTLEPQGKRWLFALDLPASIPADARITAGYEVLAHRPVHERRRDHFVSYLRYQTGALDPAMRRRSLSLPAHTNPRTHALARHWREETSNSSAVVARALAYFRRKPFYYTRRPPALGTDPVDAFLFDTRRGFCEHYAAAFVTLTRAAGVPARVVTGYQGGHWNAFGHYLVVRQSDAHAWAEVWLAGSGWRRIDPTAVIPPERVDEAVSGRELSGELAQAVARTGGWWEIVWMRTRAGWDAVNYVWNGWVLSYDRGRQAELLRALGLGATTWRELALLLAASGGAVLAVVALPLLRRQAGPRPDPVAGAYQRFCRRLAHAGVPRGAAEGPLDYASRVAHDHPTIAGEVCAITALYVRLRYGDRKGSLEELRRRVARFRP